MRLNFLKSGFLLCAAISLVSAAYAQRPVFPKGKLFIIGGGSRPPELIAELIKTAELGVNDHIAVLPMSSVEPEASYEAIKNQLSAHAGNTVAYLNFTAETVNRKAWIDSLSGAKLIFITGGDQNRFMEIVRNTPVYGAIHEAYVNGATIAGTSAGAAVMSKKMITGRQLLDTVYKETFDKLQNKNIEFEEGLGLLTSAIIDQHFIKRSRYNRLLSALAAYPLYDCIGIDESTAIIVSGKNISVVGKSQVVHLSKPKGLKTDEKQLLKMDDLRFGLYTNGDTFRLKR